MALLFVAKLYVYTFNASNFMFILKETATLMINIFNLKELFEPWILIPVSSKSVEKYGSYGRLNTCKWTLMRAAIL